MTVAVRVAVEESIRGGGVSLWYILEDRIG
jgi:hypothetical protein